jgi:hypothetical protein
VRVPVTVVVELEAKVRVHAVEVVLVRLVKLVDPVML